MDSGEISGSSVRTMFEKISLHKVAGIFVNFNLSRLLVSLFNFSTKVCQKIFSVTGAHLFHNTHIVLTKTVPNYKDQEEINNDFINKSVSLESK